MVDLDTVIDEDQIEKIRLDSYSRKPIVLNRESASNIIVGVLLTKSLVGAPLGHTLRELYVMRRAKIVIPLYSGPEQPLFECMSQFEGKKTHVCFIYENGDHAQEIDSFARREFTKLKA